MRRNRWLAVGLLAAAVWWGARLATRATGQEELWRSDQVPPAYSLTSDALIWAEGEGEDPYRHRLLRLDLATGERRSLYQGTLLRFVRQQEDGRVLCVEAGPPDTPAEGPTVFPRARVLLQDGSGVRPLVDPAPFCVEAWMEGEQVFWVATPGGEAQRLPYLPAWGRADLWVTRGGESERLATLEAPGGRWSGQLLGVWEDRLYIVERYGLPNERTFSRLLSVDIATGETQVVVVREGYSHWGRVGGQVYGVVGSPESQRLRTDLAVLRWRPGGGVEWLTDWLPYLGQLVFDRGRVYYAQLDGLWEVPERLGPARKRVGGLARPLAAAVRGPVVWVLTTLYAPTGEPVGCRLIRRRFGEEMEFRREAEL